MTENKNSFVFRKVHFFIAFAAAFLIEIGILFIIGNIWESVVKCKKSRKSITAPGREKKYFRKKFRIDLNNACNLNRNHIR